MRKAVYIIGSKGIPANMEGLKPLVENSTEYQKRQQHTILCCLYA